MARAHFVTYAIDVEGRPIGGATVTVRDPDTTTAIGETIYAEDDSAGNDTKSNPFTADSDGRVELWLENPTVVDLLVQKTGYDDETIRAHVSQLTASTLVLKDAGTPLTQRAGINFLAGFTLTDDAANDETEVALDFGETADIQDISTAAGAGASGEVADAQHVHAHPSGLGADLHHAKSHAHDGVDGSGTVAHEDLTGLTANDHHNKLHDHNGDGSGDISHDDLTDLTTGDPHTQYTLEADHTLAAHDALGLATDAEVTAHEVAPDAHHTQEHSALDHVHKGAVAQATTAQALTTGDLTAVNFGGADIFDTDAFHDPSSNNPRLVIPSAYAGKKVRCRTQIAFEGNNSGKREVFIYFHDQSAGTNTLVGMQRMNVDGMTDNSVVQVDTYPVEVATSDYFYVEVLQNSGSTLELQDRWFEIEVLGD